MTDAAPVPSALRVWWTAEPRLDAWVSAGAFALGICATVAFLAL